MFLQKIVLTNIGPYKDINNTFVFAEPDNHRNIVLIGGINGSGKTTILKSIKLGLHGNYSYGVKGNSKTYFEKVVQLFNYTELSKPQSYYCIELEFLMFENYKKNAYNFKREWNKIGDYISEKLTIKSNGLILDDLEQQLIQDKLRGIFPPYLMDSVLFDGEEIGKLIDSGSINEYLKELIMVNFNLNLFEQIHNDVGLYIKGEKKKSVLSNAELKIFELENYYDELAKKRKEIIKLELEYEKTINDQKLQIKTWYNKFQNYGGITESEKTKLLEKLKVMEFTKKENQKKLKLFLEDYLVFYLNQDFINNIKEQMNIEKPKVLIEYLGEIEQYLVDTDLSKVRDLLQAHIKENNYSPIVPSKKIEVIVNSIIAKMEHESSEYYENLFAKNKESTIESKTYRDMISLNNQEDNQELSSFLIKIINLENEHENSLSQYSELKSSKANIDSLLNNTRINIELIINANDYVKKETNSFNTARNIIKAANEFKEKQIERINKRIAHAALLKFVELSPKKNYIRKIEIETVDFRIRIFDKDLLEKNFDLFSAGEKQLIISSLIWAIFNESNRDTFFVFDTPLARLDFENRKTFVMNVMRTISKQVFILSTDQEIIGDTYDLISNSINTELLLLNNDQENKTSINPGYFGGQ